MILAPGLCVDLERINSEFEFVKDRRRNRLGHEKADKLVPLFHNLRLLKILGTDGRGIRSVAHELVARLWL